MRESTLEPKQAKVVVLPKPRSIKSTVWAGFGWGVVFGIVFPIAVVIMVALGDSSSFGGGSGGSSSKNRAVFEHRRLQYVITAFTAVFVLLLIMFVVFSFTAS